MRYSISEMLKAQGFFSGNIGKYLLRIRGFRTDISVTWNLTDDARRRKPATDKVGSYPMKGNTNKILIQNWCWWPNAPHSMGLCSHRPTRPTLSTLSPRLWLIIWAKIISPLVWKINAFLFGEISQVSNFFEQTIEFMCGVDHRKLGIQPLSTVLC